jgi:hypothetical protein
MKGFPKRAARRTFRAAAAALASVVAFSLSRAACPAEAAEGRQASESELKALLTDLSRRGGELRSLEVRFRQEKTLRILRRPRVSLGEIAFDRGKFAMTTRDQEGKVESRLLVRDGEMKLYYPVLGRLEVFPARQETPGGQGGAQAGQEVGVLLFTNGWDKLEGLYRVKLVEENPGPGEEAGGGDGGKEKRWVLILEPRESGSKLKKVEVRLSGPRIRDYRQEDASGDRIRLEVLEWKPNPQIPEERFSLEVPPDTKVSRPAGG